MAHTTTQSNIEFPPRMQIDYNCASPKDLTIFHIYSGLGGMIGNKDVKKHYPELYDRLSKAPLETLEGDIISIEEEETRVHEEKRTSIIRKINSGNAASSDFNELNKYDLIYYELGYLKYWTQQAITDRKNGFEWS